MSAGRLRIGVVCHPGLGGSGVVATELGAALGRAGHDVHVVCTGVPARFDPAWPNVTLHRVDVPEHPVFDHPPVGLALAGALIDVARAHRLDVLHVHYAVPHAASAWMASEVLGRSVAVVVTLHGSDVTTVGSDPAYREVTRLALSRCDARTAPSAFLRDEAYARLDLDPASAPIAVVPNFVDVDRWRPASAGASRAELEALFGPELGEAPVFAHVSNFRPVKRLDRVVDVFARVAERVPDARLLLVGDGPDRAAAEADLRRRDLWHRARATGGLVRGDTVIRGCAALLLPSDSESFGLAALEALASGVPVAGCAVGGLPEVVQDGLTGWLVPAGPGAGAAMAERLVALVRSPALRQELSARARADAVSRFRAEPIVARYAALLAGVAR